MIPRDEEGEFSEDEIETALQYGDAVLATMIDRPVGDFGDVPLAGTTYIDIVDPTDDAWQKFRKRAREQ